MRLLHGQQKNVVHDMVFSLLLPLNFFLSRSPPLVYSQRSRQFYSCLQIPYASHDIATLDFGQIFIQDIRAVIHPAFKKLPWTFTIAGYIYRNQYGLALIDIFLKAQLTLNIMEQMMPRRHFTGPEQLQHWAIKMSHLKSYCQFRLRSLTPLDIILNSYILICLSI